MKLFVRGDSLAVVAGKYEAAAAEIRNWETMFTAAAIQLQRFMVGNIEVDTGRTKNSINYRVQGSGNSIVAAVGAHTSYAPYVREAGHGRQFVNYAADRELPGVLAWLGNEVVAQVEGAFE